MFTLISWRNFSQLRAFRWRIKCSEEGQSSKVTNENDEGHQALEMRMEITQTWEKNKLGRVKSLR